MAEAESRQENKFHYTFDFLPYATNRYAVRQIGISAWVATRTGEDHTTTFRAIKRKPVVAESTLPIKRAIKKVIAKAESRQEKVNLVSTLRNEQSDQQSC